MQFTSLLRHGIPFFLKVGSQVLEVLGSRVISLDMVTKMIRLYLNKNGKGDHYDQDSFTFSAFCGHFYAR